MMVVQVRDQARADASDRGIVCRSATRSAVQLPIHDPTATAGTRLRMQTCVRVCLRVCQGALVQIEWIVRVYAEQCMPVCTPVGACARVLVCFDARMCIRLVYYFVLFFYGF